MTQLSINLNKVALLRNQRDIGYPDVLEAGRTILKAGADGLTVHPRPDERHTRRADVLALAQMIRQEAPDKELNVEGYPSPDFIDLIAKARPDQITLVPDPPDARTSDTGWDVIGEGAFLSLVIAKIKTSGGRVSLFIEADPRLAAAAASTGTDRIELYTGPYAFARQAGEPDGLKRYAQAAQTFAEAGLGVNAGHDLNLTNLTDFCAAVRPLNEVSIGHAFTADALARGWVATVHAYREALAS
ncbi:MAG: pyridoxine 5'-phosphate synthase [Pseudomonadota bacterium]